MLTIKQIVKILYVQADTPKLFGEIAVELGYITEADVKILLRKRKKRIPDIEDILVEMGKISSNEIDDLKKKYREEVS
ncbi:MAG: hypothetical protein GY941_07005 [Planctomycetes bacterium]|nr:hypothetical protein [Planctomycetota bacterium]